MSQSALITLVVLVGAWIFGGDILKWLSVNIDEGKDIPTEYPIFYPLEPMFENYISIIKEIEAANDIFSLNSVYVRIIVFQSCYDDSASFTSELVEAYHQKEVSIFSNH